MGRHPAFLGSSPPLPASGMVLLLREAWAALVTVARRWVGTSWPSLLPRILEHLADAPRNFVGCTALLRDVLPSPLRGAGGDLSPWSPRHSVTAPR